MEKRISLNDFIDNVIAKYIETITDSVFLTIEKDRELFHQWLDLIEDNKKRNIVNKLIAKAIRARFGLDKKKTRNKKPKSMLLKSFTEFEK